jgi:hypothetical protein
MFKIVMFCIMIMIMIAVTGCKTTSHYWDIIANDLITNPYNP